MIKKLLLLSFILGLLNANAQNPYTQFGNDAPVIKTTQEKILDLNKLTVFNSDTIAIAQAIQFDFKNGKIFVFNAKNNLIATKNISKQLLYRWLTTDPARQYASPYLGMGNNPINGTDPDGAIFTDYVWTDANGKDQSVHVNDGINQVVRISSGMSFLALGLANSGVSNPIDNALNQGLIETGT